MGASSSAQRGAVLLSPMVGAVCVSLHWKPWPVKCLFTLHRQRRALQQDCSGFEAKKTFWLLQSILKWVATQLFHSFPLLTTSAWVSITAFASRLGPDKWLRALPGKPWLQRFLMPPSQCQRLPARAGSAQRNVGRPQPLPFTVQRFTAKLLPSAVSAAMSGSAQSTCALPPEPGYSCL